jgi:hypothetical protein
MREMGIAPASRLEYVRSCRRRCAASPGPGRTSPPSCELIVILHVPRRPALNALPELSLSQ